MVTGQRVYRGDSAAPSLRWPAKPNVSHRAVWFQLVGLALEQTGSWLCGANESQTSVHAEIRAHPAPLWLIRQNHGKKSQRSLLPSLAFLHFSFRFSFFTTLSLQQGQLTSLYITFIHTSATPNPRHCRRERRHWFDQGSVIYRTGHQTGNLDPLSFFSQRLLKVLQPKPHAP